MAGLADLVNLPGAANLRGPINYGPQQTVPQQDVPQYVLNPETQQYVDPATGQPAPDQAAVARGLQDVQGLHGKSPVAVFNLLQTRPDLVKQAVGEGSKLTPVQQTMYAALKYSGNAPTPQLLSSLGVSPADQQALIANAQADVENMKRAGDTSMPLGFALAVLAMGGAAFGPALLGAGEAGTAAGTGAIDYTSGAGLESVIGGGAGTTAATAAETAAGTSAIDYTSGAGLESVTGAGGADVTAGTGAGLGTDVGAGVGGTGAGTLDTGLTAGADGITAAESAASTAAASKGFLTAAQIADLGKAFIPAVIGAVASDKQTQTLKDLADKYMAFGEPSRARYEASYAPGFTMAQDPGFTDMINQGSQGVLAGLSTKGNPYGNPSSITAATDYVTKNLAYPALQNYRNQNASTGGYGAFNTAAPGANTAAAASGANTWNALGSGLSNYLNPPANQSLKYDPATGKITFGV